MVRWYYIAVYFGFHKFRIVIRRTLHITRGFSHHCVQAFPFFFGVLLSIGLSQDMAELWTAGWLRATPHKVSSPDIGEGPRKSLVLFQAHDDLVRVCPLIMDQLNENRTETTSRAEEGLQGRSKYRRRLKIESERCPTATTVGQQIPSQCSFIEWVRHRPRAALRKYRSTTQGAWIRGQELKAKSTLLNSVGN